jgi:hypothetical protein
MASLPDNNIHSLNYSEKQFLIISGGALHIFVSKNLMYEQKIFIDGQSLKENINKNSIRELEVHPHYSCFCNE